MTTPEVDSAVLECARIRDEALERARVAEERAAQLEQRHQDHLQLIAKLTRETPYPAELDECRSARAKLIAEVGTLRATLSEAYDNYAAHISALQEWTERSLTTPPHSVEAARAERLIKSLEAREELRGDVRHYVVARLRGLLHDLRNALASREALQALMADRDEEQAVIANLLRTAEVRDELAGYAYLAPSTARHPDFDGRAASNHAELALLTSKLPGLVDALRAKRGAR